QLPRHPRLGRPSHVPRKERAMQASDLQRPCENPRRFRRWLSAALLAGASSIASTGSAQTTVAPPPMPEPPADESVLGELLITGDTEEHITPLAVLPSLSPELEDVIVRGVVRRDFELTGMFKVIPDEQAPEGLYGFDDPVDIKAWSKRG